MTEIIKIGVVGVDSGQLIICDPCYIEQEFKTETEGFFANHAHTVYRCVKDGKLWQYTYGEPSSIKDVNLFPGSYETVIPEYSQTPNTLIANGTFVETDLDPTPHIEDGEFSYRGSCKATLSPDGVGQLNYKLGHPGVAVAFRSGLGDGEYNVYAEIGDVKGWGRRVKKVWIDLIEEEE